MNWSESETTLNDYFSTCDTLTDKEIDVFISELRTERPGIVSFHDLARKLEAVLANVAPESQQNHGLAQSLWQHRSQASSDHRIEAGLSARLGFDGYEGVHKFLHNLIPACSSSNSKEEFREVVRAWNVPSRHQRALGRGGQGREDDYQAKISVSRRIRAYWSLKGPRTVFAVFVASTILAFGLWQFTAYLNNWHARAAFGWGVVMAKLFVG